jgi:acyl-CoA dehydrogenase
MDFSLPAELVSYLARLDAFIAAEIAPLQAQNDNQRFFDHRREWARTDFEGGGLPRREWEELLGEARRRADRAGFYRFSLPREYGGDGGSNLWMAVIREHLASQGLGLHNDLQNEHSVVGNFPFIVMMRDFGTAAQKEQFIRGSLAGKVIVAFGLTEPLHGSDATHMETRAVREQRDGVDGWRIDGEKMWTTGMHVATHCVVFARTSGEAGRAQGISAFLVPTTTPGMKVEEYLWTFNMPTDHPRVSLTNVWVPDSAVFGAIDNGLPIAQAFVHENRIRQAATPASASRSVKRWLRTRRFSGRWSSSRPRRRCCGS